MAEGLRGLEFRFVRNHRPEKPTKVRTLPRPKSGIVVRGRFVRSSGQHSQRVIVKVQPKWQAGNHNAIRNSVRGKADYLARYGALDGLDEKGEHLTLDQVHEKLAAWDGDERYDNIMFSPDEARRLDLDEFTSRTMAKLREDVLTADELKRDVEIEYVIYQHWDTEHPHTQVLMRAKVEDRELHLSNGYVSHGLRARAEEVATGMLGYRIEREVSVEEDRRLLMARREERGLDPETGRHPDEKTAEDGGKSVSKAKDVSRDRRGFDGGID
jgi:hypothetical protein